ncbi:hypothetical protein [Lactococcus lactis]|uniref:hypothetical protein n=1 Tax=Lactococcus lactis TaxID=1358 RepID=UPI003DA83B21
MKTDFWNNFWMVIVGILSLGTSIVAIYLAYKANKQVEKQMELSNKQLLFEKRIEVYNVIDEIEIACSVKLNSKNKLTTENIDEFLIGITVDEYFEKINNITSIEVGAQSLEDTHFLEKYLDALKKITLISETLFMVFDETEYLVVVSSFFIEYINLLRGIYEYYRTDTSLNEVQNQLNNLENIYNKMNDSDSLEKLRKSIKLF